MRKARHLIICAILFLMAGFIMGRLSLPTGQNASGVFAGPKNPLANEPAKHTPADKFPASKPLERQTTAQVEASLQALAGNLASEARFDELVQKLIDWAGTDPNAALDYARGHFANEQQSQVLGRVLAALARNNPQAAWGWTFKNAPGDFQHIDAVLNEIGKTDAAAAWSFAMEYAAKYTNDACHAYIGAFRGMAYGGNYDEAARLMKEANLITPPGGDYDLPALVASQWARFEPQKAAAWVLSLPDGTAREESLLQIGNSWAQADPLAAADFAAGLPSGNTRQRVMTQAVRCWAESDPVAAAEWINQLDPSPDFDQVIMAIANSPQADPRTAVQWAKSITQKELRVQSLTRILWAWTDRDYAAAMGFLQNSSDLPADVRDEVLHRIETKSER